MVVGDILIAGLHVLAAVIAVGGSFFINMVLDRITPSLAPPEKGKVNQGVGTYFSPIAWACIAVLLITGLMRASFVGALNTDVLLGSTYGNLLLGKMIILLVITVNAVFITRTGLSLKAMSKEGPPPPEAAAAASARIRRLGITSMSLGLIAVVFAVAMRAIGVP